jgi:transketolase
MMCKYLGASGPSIGRKTFGSSAPAKELQAKFGFKPQGIVAGTRERLGRG